jgi:hypothetical protein
MSHKSRANLYQLCRVVGLLFIGALCAFPPGPPAAVVSGQTDCTSYNQCLQLQGESLMKLTGNITYSIDEASLSLLSSDAARQNFRSMVSSAASHWAQRTGRSITAAPAGQSGNVTLRVSNRPEVREGSGLVSVDPANSARRIIEFSDEFNAYSEAGQLRLTKHEWGHVLGFKDVPTDACPGVLTIM